METSSFLTKVLDTEDAEQYMQLRLKALQESPENFLVTYQETIEQADLLQSFRERLKPTDHAYTMGIFDEEQLVSIATLVRDPRVKVLHKAGLMAVYTDPAYRKKGLSKQLVRTIMKKAKEMEGIEQIYLTVVKTNKAAISLYQSLGFRTYGIEKHAMKWNGRYCDEDHMVLFL
ncbi:GNAT family N-acetyltransferase [Bacillus sp. V59.32b]|uniref:GNAT family N-acetyltransferase n=1 Tax=Bacillus sp. V59.32b TaxID=1758642 RepID=UPI00135C328D|nr:GNAT family N-acetyltransferase [Bacillus sp. V59.32b]